MQDRFLFGMKLSRLVYRSLRTVIRSTYHYFNILTNKLSSELTRKASQTWGHDRQESGTVSHQPAAGPERTLELPAIFSFLMLLAMLSTVSLWLSVSTLYDGKFALRFDMSELTQDPVRSRQCLPKKMAIMTQNLS